MNNREQENKAPGFTPNEIDLVQHYISSGVDHLKELAPLRNVEPSTLKSESHALCEKVGAHSFTRVVVYMLDQHVVTLPYDMGQPYTRITTMTYGR